jgi:glutamate 5-kinase
VPTVIGAATDVVELLAGNPERGTRFFATGQRGTSRMRWLAHASVPRGRLVLDAGAVIAVRDRGASLLPAGIVSIEGAFAAGDPVELVGPDDVPLARGLVAYDAAELPALLGVSTRENGLREVVHRDDLVLLPR